MASTPALCANCGAELRTGASFCAACGHNVTRAAVSSVIPPPPPPTFIPPPPVYVLMPAAATKAKHGWSSWSTGKRMVYVFILLPLLAVATFAIVMAIISSQNHSSVCCAINPTLEFTSDYNAMIVIDNADIIQQNSQDATTSIAGLQARAAAHKNFDNQVAALVFTGSARADQQKVLDTDNALEQVLVQMAANRSNTKNYNAVLATEQPLADAFAAAAIQLGKD